MALPENKIKKIKLPGDVEGNKTYEIVPDKLSDGSTNFKATLPTLTEDSTIVLDTTVTNYQSSSVVVGNAVTNINGRVFQNYTATLVTAGGYTFYQILKNGNNPTEAEAAEYMRYMTGSLWVPKYNYDFPKQTIFTFADRSTWKPQYSSTDGLRLYRLTTSLALESDIITDYNDLANKPTLGTAAALNTGTSSGNVPVLDSNGKLADSVIPAVAITDTYEASSEAAMLALTAQKGDVCIRSDLNKSFILSQTPASTLANWKELKTPTDAVLSVNGETGAVTLDAADVGALADSTNYLASASASGNTLTITPSSGSAITYIPSFTDNDHYPTTFAWTNGTTAGPTGSLTGNSGFTAVSFGAIPAASHSQSGIVTTESQNFAGSKHFGDGISVSVENSGEEFLIYVDTGTGKNNTFLQVDDENDGLRSYWVTETLTANRTYTFQDKTGVIALTSDIAENITYSALCTLISQSKLIPGKQYRITDYVTTTIQSGTASAGHPFDIIVTAISANDLNPHARATSHAGVYYFDDADDDIELWDLIYNINNNWWSDQDNGKGTILYLCDSYGNATYYDFKNILFTFTDREGVTHTNVYTFNKELNDGNYDATLYEGQGSFVYNNKINIDLGPYSFGTLPVICFNSQTTKFMCADNTINIGRSNYILNCYIDADYTLAQSGCVGNTFTAGDSPMDGLYIGTGCRYNYFVASGDGSTIGTFFESNIIGKLQDFEIGDHVQHCIFLSAGIIIPDYCRNITIDPGCRYAELTCLDTAASSSNWLQNIHIHSGVTSSTVTISDRNLPYETDVYMGENNNLIYRENNGISIIDLR